MRADRLGCLLRSLVVIVGVGGAFLLLGFALVVGWGGDGPRERTWDAPMAWALFAQALLALPWALALITGWAWGIRTAFVLAAIELALSAFDVAAEIAQAHLARPFLDLALAALLFAAIPGAMMLLTYVGRRMWLPRDAAASGRPLPPVADN